MLDENAMRLYSFSIGNSRWSEEDASVELNISLAEVDAAKNLLLKHHLLHAFGDDAAFFTANPPDVAVATVVETDVQRVHQLQGDIARRRGEMLALMPLYRELKVASSSSEHLEILEDGDMVTRYLSEASRDVCKEVLAVQPSPISTVERARLSAAKDIELLERGVQRKTLRRDRDRDHAPTVFLSQELAPYGAEHRTVATLPLRAMIFDRSAALISRPTFDCDFAAIVVHSPDMVASLAAVFDSVWDMATPMNGDSEPAHSVSKSGGLSAVQASILDGLAMGLTDEAIASRIGVSVRTCRRHIATIFEVLGADSRFQAGAIAVSRGLLRPALLK